MDQTKAKRLSQTRKKAGKKCKKRGGKNSGFLGDA
jgi:hypothetical protein